IIIRKLLIDRSISTLAIPAARSRFISIVRRPKSSSTLSAYDRSLNQRLLHVWTTPSLITCGFTFCPILFSCSFHCFFFLFFLCWFRDGWYNGCYNHLFLQNNCQMTSALFVWVNS